MVSALPLDLVFVGHGSGASEALQLGFRLSQGDAGRLQLSEGLGEPLFGVSERTNQARGLLLRSLIVDKPLAISTPAWGWNWSQISIGSWL